MRARNRDVRSDLFEPLESRQLLATYWVDTTVDESDGNFAAGDLSLREAVQLANATAGADEVRFSSSIRGGGIHLNSEIPISDSVTIGGLNENGDPADLLVSGQNASRIFNISDGDSDRTIDVTISYLVLYYGSGSLGGAIYSTESLSLTQTTVGFSSASSEGGGIYQVGGSLTVKQSVVRSNSAFNGAGILATGASVLIDRSEVSANTATYEGGGLRFRDTTSVVIRNSTISGNTAPVWGGGIAAWNPNNGGEATYLIAGSTFSLNRADSDGNGTGRGGGMHINGGTLRLESTLLDKNYAGAGSFIDDIDVFGSTVLDPASSNNLIGDGADGGGLVHGQNGNLVGVDSMLGPLQFHGGRTRTHALPVGSPAIDAGSNSGDRSTDQRTSGFFVREFGAGPDIGAFERQSISITADSTQATDDKDYRAGRLGVYEAFVLTNGNPGADRITIDLPGQTFTPVEVLQIVDDLEVVGPGSGSFTIDARNHSRSVVSISGGASINVSLEGMRLINGGGGTQGAGVSIENATVTLTDVAVADYNADGNWAGVFVSSSALTMRRSSITGGTSGAAALALFGSSATLDRVEISGNSGGSIGGIYVDSNSTMTMDRSSVTGNTSRSNSGGGIWALGSTTLTNSLVSGNSASGAGGGIYASLAAGASLRVSNSTISGNSATSDGGGIYATASSATNSIVIENSTIAGNRADSDGNGGSGGGLWFSRTTPVVMAVNSTIVAGNLRGGGDGSPDDIVNGGSAPLTPATSGHNLVGDAATAGGLDTSNGNLLGVDPLLGSLTDNGGPTMTHALLDGSPALGAGSNASGLTSDQRGVLFKRLSGKNPDIGAYERQRLFLTVDTARDESDGDFEPGDLSLREAVEQANANPMDDTIDFAGSVEGSTISLRRPSLTVSGNLTVSGPGTSKLTVDAGGGSRIFTVNDGDSGTTISVTISGLRLTGGSATNGGAIYNAENLTLSGVSIVDNAASQDGGAIHNVGRLTITGSTLSRNAAGDDGGAIDNDGEGVVTITDSKLRENSAVGTGGAITNGERGTVVIRESLLGSNTTGGNGGGVYNDGVLTLEGSRLSANRAEGHDENAGGGVYNSQTGTLTVLSSTLAENFAIIAGGGIENLGVVTITESTLSGNASFTGEGGGIDNFGGSVTIVRSTLSGNKAGGSGGAVWTDTTLVVRSSTISGNWANGWGGGIGMFDGEVEISNSTIAFNTADRDGDGEGQGGGIDVGRREGRGVLTTNSSIYANNLRGPNGGPDDISRTNGSVEGRNNIIADRGTFDSPNGSNGNQFDVDPLLGALADNGGPTLTHAIYPGSPAIDAGRAIDGAATDQRGLARSAGGGTDVGAFEWAPTPFDLGAVPATLVRGAAEADDTQHVLVRNRDGDWVVFRGSGSVWQAQRLRDHTDAPAATGDGLVWTDPADGLVYIAGPSTDGFLLFRRAENGRWSYRNLSDELGLNGSSPVDRFTQFVTQTGRVSVGGYTASGQLVLLQQTGGRNASGATWSFKNLSDDLASQGMRTPNLVEITSYVTPWDQWTIAGIDSRGNIQGVWVFTPSFTTWRVDNLSALYGTPRLSGQLTVIQTAWNAINLAGADENGNLIVTWWVPRFRNTGWAVNNLTSEQGGSRLADGRITGFVTPWGAMNYAGLDASGEIVAYWWVPSLRWNVSSLTQRISGSQARPTGTITNHVSSVGTMSVLGTADDGGVTRLWWSPNGDNQWKLTDLTDLAVRT